MNAATNWTVFWCACFICAQEQQASCTGKLQQTTGLIQFCIEALKETDSAAFLQVMTGNCFVVFSSLITHKQLKMCSFAYFACNKHGRSCLYSISPSVLHELQTSWNMLNKNTVQYRSTCYITTIYFAPTPNKNDSC